jgi:two-component system chemotaxis sensor kinase CheA
LVFKSTPQDLKAVPLGLVSRLEEFEISEIEHNYGMPVVQYRGQLMPIIKSSADIGI